MGCNSRMFNDLDNVCAGTESKRALAGVLQKPLSIASGVSHTHVTYLNLPRYAYAF